MAISTKHREKDGENVIFAYSRPLRASIPANVRL